MVHKFGAALAAILVMTGTALADPIEGDWKTKDGPIATIASCGGSFCITMKTGKYVGKRIGKMTPAGDGGYSGTITDPKDDKTYTGSASVSGSSLKLTGCALKIFCKSQTWKKQ
jgi:uncharacterized protein (DUF2147 family)